MDEHILLFKSAALNEKKSVNSARFNIYIHGHFLSLTEVTDFG